MIRLMIQHASNEPPDEDPPPKTGEVVGRGPDGKFAPGWKGGPGNPAARRSSMFRLAMVNAVTPEDIEDVIKAMVAEAKLGNVFAAREVLNRCCGAVKPATDDDAERITKIIIESIDAAPRVMADE